MSDQPGPGMKWLSEVSGRSPDQILADPKALSEAVGAAGNALVELVQRLGSDDPAVRAAAELEAGDLRERMESGPTPGERLRGRIQAVLDDVLVKLRDD